MAFSATLLSSRGSRAGAIAIVYTVADGLGRTFGPFIERASENVDVDLRLARIAAAIEESCKGREIAELLERLDGTAPVYATNSDIAAAVREAFRTATNYELHRLARWIVLRMTDGQIRALFGLTAQQLVGFKARLEAMRDRINAMEAEAGA